MPLIDWRKINKVQLYPLSNQWDIDQYSIFIRISMFWINFNYLILSIIISFNLRIQLFMVGKDQVIEESLFVVLGSHYGGYYIPYTIKRG